MLHFTVFPQRVKKLQNNPLLPLKNHFKAPRLAPPGLPIPCNAWAVVTPVPIFTLHVSSPVVSVIDRNYATYSRSINVFWLPSNETAALLSWTTDWLSDGRMIACLRPHIGERSSDGSDKSELQFSIILPTRIEKAGRNFLGPSIDRTRRERRRAEPSPPRRSAGWLNLENVIAFVDDIDCAQTAYETHSLASPCTYPQLVNSRSPAVAPKVACGRRDTTRRFQRGRFAGVTR